MNWQIERDTHNVAWLHLNQAGSGTNVLSQPVLAELDGVLTALRDAPPTALILLSDKPNGFIAGADIRELAALQSPEAARELIARADAILARLEGLGCPTVAMIHGYCLGGGLELALACRYRIGRDDTGTRLGLPEVRLGIHPGLGGSVRLPRLIGSLPGLRLMLAGRLVGAREALRLGLVNRIAPERAWRRAALDLALRPPRPHRKPWLDLPRPLRGIAAGYIKRQTAARANPAHYPAPAALIDVWAHEPADLTAALAAEAHSMADLLFTPTARNLMRLFTLETRLKAYAKGSASGVHHVHVIGAGTMGAAIAAWTALRGYTVSLSDQNPAALGRAVREAGELFTAKLRTEVERTAAWDRLIPDAAQAGLAHADLVIEAIVENAEAKRSLFAAVESRLKPDALLASNTSAIPLAMIGSALRDPSRLVGMHFFNPVSRVRLIEVVSGEQTREDVHRRALAFVLAIDRLPLPVRSSPGFVVNRCLLPYLMEAVLLESEGIPATLIDNAATAFGMPMGPLALGDLVGLDVCLDVIRELFPARVPARLQALVEAGKKGLKSGEGFYRYRGGRPVRSDSRPESPPADLTDRLVLPMLNEAVAVLSEGLVGDPDDIDAGMVFGAGVIPHRGGPMQYLRQRGEYDVRQTLERLAAVHGERFVPHPALARSRADAA